MKARADQVHKFIPKNIVRVTAYALTFGKWLAVEGGSSMVRYLVRYASGFSLIFLLCASVAAAEVLQYTYDDAGQLLKVEHDSGAVVDYSYDALGNRLSRTTSLSASFNNPPDQPLLLSPANAATDINSVGAMLEWTGGTDPDPEDKVYYDVYFGESPQPPLYNSALTANSLALTALPLRSLTTYYWKIVARDNFNAKTSSEIWNFTTGNNIPGMPSDFMPQDNSYVLGDDVYLSWSASIDQDPLDTVTYDVYFGTSATPPLVGSNISTTSFHVGTLDPRGNLLLAGSGER